MLPPGAAPECFDAVVRGAALRVRGLANDPPVSPIAALGLRFPLTLCVAHVVDGDDPIGAGVPCQCELRQPLDKVPRSLDVDYVAATNVRRRGTRSEDDN